MLIKFDKNLHQMLTSLTSTLALTMSSFRADVPDEPPESPYGYIPGMANTIAFTTVFSLLTLVHLILAVKYKYWSAIVTMVIGGLLEIIGWAARLWSAKNVLIWDPFIMQTCW